MRRVAAAVLAQPLEQGFADIGFAVGDLPGTTLQVWPQAKDGVVSLTPAQLSMLTEGIDWRMPARTWQPEVAG